MTKFTPHQLELENLLLKMNPSSILTLQTKFREASSQQMAANEASSKDKDISMSDSIEDGNFEDMITQVELEGDSTSKFVNVFE